MWKISIKLVFGAEIQTHDLLSTRLFLETTKPRLQDILIIIFISTFTKANIAVLLLIFIEIKKLWNAPRIDDRINLFQSKGSWIAKQDRMTFSATLLRWYKVLWFYVASHLTSFN